MIKQAAESIGCSRIAIYKRIQSDPELKEAIEQCREDVLDIAENALMKNVKEGKEASVFFLLKTLGKKRGFIEKSILDLNDNREAETDIYKGLSDGALEEIARGSIKAN